VTDSPPDRLVRSTAVVATGTLLSRITGLGRVIAAAYALGATASRLADAYNLANTLPNQLYELALGGVLTSVLIPVVVEELARRDTATAWRNISFLFFGGLTVAAFASTMLAAAAPLLINLTGPGLGSTDRDLAVTLLQLFSAQVFFYAATALAGGLLNAQRRFAVPAYAPVLNNIVVIGVFVAFAVMLDGPLRTDLPGRLVVLLGLGTTAGVAAMAVANVPSLLVHASRLRPRLSLRAPILGKVLRLSTWTALYVATNQVGLVVVQRLASQTTGGIAGWTYAFMFFQLPNGVFAVSVMTALLPSLAEHATHARRSEFRSTLGAGIRLTLFLILPAAVAYTTFATPMIRLLLEAGSFGAEDTVLVSELLRLFGLGLVPFTIFLLTLRAWYALQDTRTPFVVNLAATALAVGFDIALYPVLDVNTLALGHALSYTFAAAVGLGLLRRRLGGLDGKRALQAAAKVALACAPLAAVLIVVDWAFGSPSSGIGGHAEVAVGVVCGAVVYLAAAALCGVEEIRELRQLLARRRSHGSRHADHRGGATPPA
jgi:putative peptidoglycan lipid II flippase